MDAGAAQYARDLRRLGNETPGDSLSRVGILTVHRSIP